MGEVLDGAARRYGDWFDAAESAFVADYRELSPEAGEVWARLSDRQGPWFRVAGLGYADAERACEELVARGFAEPPAAEDGPGPWLATTPLTLLRPLAGLGGSAALAAVHARLHDAGLLASALGPVVRPARMDVFRRICLWYFGNAWDGPKTLLLAELGLLKHVPYPLDDDGRLFRSREDFDGALWLIRAEAAVAQAGDVEALAEVARGLFERPRPANAAWQRRHDRVVGALGAALERAGALDLALAVWGRGWRPPARERVVRIIAAQRRTEAALAMLSEVARCPRDESEAEFARAFRPRLQRKVGLRPAVSPVQPVRELTLRCPPGLPAERRALEALAPRGFEGAHAENRPWRILFVLTVWDAIWAPVPGAFHHPFHAGPEDLLDPSFREARAPLIAQCLDAVRGEGWREVMLERLRTWRGTVNRMVVWSEADEPLFERFLCSLSADAVVAVVDRMASDVQAWSTGFPDLVLWDSAGRMLLREVKSEGDRLQANQIRWLGILSGLGLDAAVLNLVGLDAPESELG